MSIRIPKNAKPYHIPVGLILRDARESAGLRQCDVAARLRVTSNTICHWEIGRRSPHIDMVDAYLRVCKATLTLGTAA